MTTQKQIEANQRNARQSTGPRTAEGKAASSQNAYKHGVLSTKAVVSRYEDREAYEALREQLSAELQPASVIECNLVERLALLFLRERRLGQAEASEITCKTDLQESINPMGLRRHVSFQDQNLIGRYQGMLSRQTRETLRDLREEQERRMQVIEHRQSSADEPEHPVPTVRIRRRPQ